MSGVHAASHLVDAEWLDDHLDEVIVLDASISRGVGSDGRTTFGNGRTVFEAGHIPGARFADMQLAFSDPDAPFAFTKPTIEQFRRACTAVGVGAGATVVVYDQLTGAYAARLWWLFDAFGIEGVRVLDGGLGAWRAGGRPLETGPSQPVAPPSTEVDPVERDGAFIGLDEMTRISSAGDQSTVVLCAVRSREYTGEDGNPRPGHIPGSLSAPYPALLADDGLLDAARTARLIEQAGLEQAEQIVLYCGGGINATGLALALREAGLTRMSVYDGSLNEWRANPDLPLVTGAEPR